jgi:hypothetical protein
LFIEGIQLRKIENALFEEIETRSPLFNLQFNRPRERMLAQIITASLAFSGSAPVRSSSRGAVRMAEMSKAVPFLVLNKNLEGLAGSVGFDPLGLSNGPLCVAARAARAAASRSACDAAHRARAHAVWHRPLYNTLCALFPAAPSPARSTGWWRPS